VSLNPQRTGGGAVRWRELDRLPDLEEISYEGKDLGLIRQNVVINVEKLKNATPIIDKAVTEKRVRIVGAVYNLDSGRVELLG
jgi:carbonic anhydrase